MGKKILTLDIGAVNIALAEYDLGPQGPELANYGFAALGAPLDAENAGTVLTPALGEIVREKGIRPGPVCISVSGQIVFPKFAAIPDAGGADKFEQAVRFEVEQNIPFPIDEMVCDRQVLGDTETGDKSVMIVAAKLDQMTAITDAVAGAGFRPDVIGVAPLALASAAMAADGDESCRVLLDIGARTTSLVILEGDKVYNRSIPIGGNNINRDIAQALHCTPAEAEQIKLEKGYVSLGGVAEDEDPVADSVAKVCRAVLSRIHAEISRSINFYRSQQGGGAPTKLLLCGGTSLLPQIDQFFADSLQVEVAYLNPFEAFPPSAKVDAEALSTDAAMLVPTAGLALAAAGRAKFSINLLPPSVTAARREKARIPVVAAAGAALVLALVVVLLAVKREGRQLDERLEAVQAQTDKLKGWQTKIAAAEQSVTAAQREADGLKKLLASRKSALGRLDAARHALMRGGETDGLWLEGWSVVDAVKGKYDKLTVRCWKDRAEALAEFVEKHGGKRDEPTSETVARKLGDRTDVVEKGSVRIADMSSVGTSVEQFSVEVKFK